MPASRPATWWSALDALGAECIECPTIRVGDPDTWGPLDTAVQNLADYHWLVFTSVNGVRFFFQRLFASGRDVRALGHLKTAVIGPATEKSLAGFGINSDIVPAAYRAESVIEAFAGQDVRGLNILLPRAAEARPILPEELTRMGAAVHEVPAYRTRIAEEGRDALLENLEAGRVDMVTFTSSSTAKNFKSLLPEDRLHRLMQGVRVASIGPITTDTAVELGFVVDVTASTFTIDGLVAAVVSAFDATV